MINAKHSDDSIIQLEIKSTIVIMYIQVVFGGAVGCCFWLHYALGCIYIYVVQVSCEYIWVTKIKRYSP